jgi:hypothetical protein
MALWLTDAAQQDGWFMMAWPGSGAPSQAQMGTKRLRYYAAVAVFLACLLYALQAGLRPRNPAQWIDFKYFYVVGKCWLHHDSPYRPEVFRRVWSENLSWMVDAAGYGTVPMPWLAVVWVPLALLPFKAAAWAYSLLNISALGMSLRYTALLTFGDASGKVAWREPSVWLALAACCLNAGVPTPIYVGQPTLFAVAGQLGLLHHLRHRRLWPSIGCLFLTGMKPNVALLPVIYVLLAGGWRDVFIGSVLTAALTLPIFATVQPLQSLLEDMRRGSAGYAAAWVNRPPIVSGLNSLLAGTPFQLPVGAWLVVAIALTAGLALESRVRTRQYGRTAGGTAWWARHVAFLAVFEAVFLPLKEYDSAIFLPAIAFAVRSGFMQMVAFAPGLLMVCRSNNLVGPLRFLGLGKLQLTGSLVMTQGALCLFVVLAAQTAVDARARWRQRLVRLPPPDELPPRSATAVHDPSQRQKDDP